MITIAQLENRKPEIQFLGDYQSDIGFPTAFAFPQTYGPKNRLHSPICQTVRPTSIINYYASFDWTYINSTNHKTILPNLLL